jgi:hypothetical protein
MSIEELDLSELRELYHSMERRYAALGKRNEELEDKVRALESQHAILGLEKAQWEASKGLQSSLIHEQLADKDQEIQSMAEIIVQLRARLRERSE